ncbi:hypothetical protein WBG78_21545 [Chryseolinea sp. T2]|uniref:hypothetical protein n=1 Tax=Chryseolinea sp. T2 TaxID=3129255 RepID=UPI003076E941
MHRCLLIVVIFFVSVGALKAQQKRNAKGDTSKEVRSFKVKRGDLVILRDTSFLAHRDTTVKVPARQARHVKIRRNPSAIAAMFYDSLEQRAASGKVTKDVFNMVMKKHGNKERLVNSIIVSEEVFKPFEGMKIKSISIRQVDVLEGSVIDTLQKATTKVGVFVNRVHRDTRTRLVQRNLLIKAGEEVDAYRLADNERVLRQFRPLRDARIYLSRDKKDKNAVHVVVATQDVASLGFAGARRSWKDFRFDVFHVNLGGTGTLARISYYRNEYYQPHNGWEFALGHPNLFGSFIKGEAVYTNNFMQERVGVSFSRDYFTPEIKVGGGLTYNQSHENFYIDGYDTLRTPHQLTMFEIWGGRSFQIRKRTNLILNALVNERKYSQRPFVSSDSNVFLHDRTMVAGNIWLVKRNYLKSLRIRGFGRTEDIPVGAGVGFMYGHEFSEFNDRNYFQLDLTMGKYFPRVGYLNVLATGGTYLVNGKGQDGLLSLNATAFSDLIRLRRTQMRNFIFFEWTRGYNRILDRTLIVTGKWRDNQGNIPVGNRRLSIGLESDYFMPWYFYGFQFTLYYRGDIYLLSKDDLIDRRSLFYSVKAGIRMLNENLVLPGFTIELGYYGKNSPFPAAWQLRFITTLPDLFPVSTNFKPQVRTFD